jgi:hypothetical protein
MHKELPLQSDCNPDRHSKKMCVDALDIATSYKNNQQNLKLAVSITDLSGYPVYNGGVELFIDPPNGARFSIETKTDPYGIAIFELENVESGSWKVEVLKINHPHYQCEMSSVSKRWSITQV